MAPLYQVILALAGAAKLVTASPVTQGAAATTVHTSDILGQDATAAAALKEAEESLSSARARAASAHSAVTDCTAMMVTTSTLWIQKDAVTRVVTTGMHSRCL